MNGKTVLALLLLACGSIAYSVSQPLPPIAVSAGEPAQ